MATLDTIRPIATQNGPRTFFVSLFAAIAAWNDQRVTRNALERLSDRELQDIGLLRADIDSLTGKH
jgi:uncharacterized protein YjiS (DUF1127 family)